MERANLPAITECSGNLDGEHSSSSIEEICFLKKQKISDGEHPSLISIESIPSHKQSKMHRSNFYDFVHILSNIENFDIDQTKFESILKGSLKSKKTKFTIQEIQILYSQNFQSYIIPEKVRSKWNNEEIIIFVWLALSLSVLNDKEIDAFNDLDWSCLSEMIPNTTCTRLKMKWVSLQNSKNQKEPWSVEDLCLLSEIVLKNQGNKWAKIAEEFNSKSNSKIVRLGKHCREKWNNHLNPELKKGNWTYEEDLILLYETLKQDRPSWASISKKLVNRNENLVKNRFYTLLNIHALSRKKGFDYQSLKLLIKKKIIELQDHIKIRQTNLALHHSYDNISNFNNLYINSMNLFNNNPFLNSGLINNDKFLHYQPFYNPDLDSLLPREKRAFSTETKIKFEEPKTKESQKNTINCNLTHSFSKLGVKEKKIRRPEINQKSIKKENLNMKEENTSFFNLENEPYKSENNSGSNVLEKKNENLPVNSENSIFSLCEINREYIQRQPSANSSSLSSKENRFLISALLNLNSGSSSSGINTEKNKSNEENK